MDLGLSDKVCVVTGSTGGIGLEVARAARRRRARSSSRPAARDGGIGDLHVAADLAQPGEPERLVAATLERFGRVDCLVNNVGGAEIRVARRADRRRLAASCELNLMSAVRATAAALPAMRERGGGAIVNVSSTAGKRPSRGMPDYSVMKAAMLSFSRLVADLYAKDGDPLQRGHAGPDRDRRRGSATAGSPTSRATATRCSQKVGAGPSARPARRAGGDRRGDRLPLLATERVVRDAAPPGRPTAAPSRSSSDLHDRPGATLAAMPELAGRVADAFAARMRELEERCAVAARRALVRDARPRAGRGRVLACGRRSSATATASSTRSRSGA